LGGSPTDTGYTDRLPTVSASAALDELTNEAGSNISTGLTELDRALATNSSLNGPEDECPGGILRGQVTELWGPPGAGKTALG
jgi:RecA/RadA recombinase